MGLQIFFILGMVLNLAHSSDLQGRFRAQRLGSQTNSDRGFGEEVYLDCQYTGQIDIMYSSWNRLYSSKKSKKMAGYNLNNPFNKENFDIPASLTNLTVKMNVTSLDLEGDYSCVFNSEEDETKDTMFLRVIARPVIDTTVKKEVVNRTLYHAVTCSASSAKPEAVIKWDISGAPPRDDIFSVNMTNTVHSNGTTSSVSVLRFPLTMNNESTVTCVVEHPAFTEPERANIELDTFVSPIMNMEIILVQEDEEDFQEVICTATGGRPHPNITWRLPEFNNTPPLLGNDSKPDSVISSYRFPSNPYEGKSVSCVFGYMFLPFINTRTITLPIYYLSSLQLKDIDYANSENQTLSFEEGDVDITIKMNVLGNVPSYKINCSREGQPLPEDVDMRDSDIFIRGPLQMHLAGQYLCQASYRRHEVSLQFTIEVNPKVLLPVTFPPNISVNLEQNSDHIQIECLAFNAVPAANVSWVISQEMNSMIQSVTSYNGSYSVRSVLTVPNCMAREHVAECVVDHPAFMEKERRQIALPVCAPPNITLQFSIKWDSGVAYTWLVCSVQSQTPVVAINWTVDCHGIDIGSNEFVMSQPGFQHSHTVPVQSVARIPIYTHAGCSVTCAVEIQGLEKPENKTIELPSLGPSASRLWIGFVGEERNTYIWHAVCEYSGDGVKPNISWVLPDEDTVIQPTAESKCDGIKVQVNSTYKFQLSQYEGKDLICLIQNELGRDEKRSIRVPKYSISSIEVVNETTLNRRSHEHRIELQENLSNQKILLRVHGNAPSYKTTCYREDGSAAHTVNMALVFPERVSELDAGLYLCHVSYQHHMAKVFIRVDVTSEETQHMILITTCLASATALALVLIIVLFVLCKSGNDHSSQKKNRKERESLAALMQDPRCPERTALTGEAGPHYSIVFDVRSTV